MIDQDKLLQPGSHASAPASVDLGPLAWVVDSLHDTLNDVREQLTTFSEEVKAASGSHLTTLDTAVLREAAQSLHEAVGVLDLVERPAAAKVAGAMERCVQLFITNPELCTPDAAQTVVQAGISVLDYLGNLLKGRPDLSPGLFPAYRDVAQLAGIDRIHPADLWHGPWQWLEVKDFAPPPTEHAPQSASAPAFLDGVLQLFRSNGASGAEQLAARTQQLWQQGTAAKERVFWQLANAFLQLQAAQALNFDDQIKRLLSRVAVQYDLLQQQAQPGEVSERLAQDLLYFIALGHHKKPSAPAPLAQAIGRLRCLVQGCCHGRPVFSALGLCVRHPRSRVAALSHLRGVPIHPTQLYSIVGNLCIFAVLWRHAPGTCIAGLYLVLASLARFAEEQYRGEVQTRTLAGLAIYQWLALGMCVAGMAVSAWPAAPVYQAAQWGWASAALAVAGGAVAAFLMSVDFPRSRARFSRLTVDETAP